MTTVRQLDLYIAFTHTNIVIKLPILPCKDTLIKGMYS